MYKQEIAGRYVPAIFFCACPSAEPVIASYWKTDV